MASESDQQKLASVRSQKQSLEAARDAAFAREQQALATLQEQEARAAQGLITRDELRRFRRFYDLAKRERQNIRDDIRVQARAEDRVLDRINQQERIEAKRDPRFLAMQDDLVVVDSASRQAQFNPETDSFTRADQVRFADSRRVEGTPRVFVGFDSSNTVVGSPDFVSRVQELSERGDFEAISKRLSQGSPDLTSQRSSNSGAFLREQFGSSAFDQAYRAVSRERNKDNLTLSERALDLGRSGVRVFREESFSAALDPRVSGRAVSTFRSNVGAFRAFASVPLIAAAQPFDAASEIGSRFERTGSVLPSSRSQFGSDVLTGVDLASFALPATTLRSRSLSAPSSQVADARLGSASRARTLSVREGSVAPLFDSEFVGRIPVARRGTGSTLLSDNPRFRVELPSERVSTVLEFDRFGDFVLDTTSRRRPESQLTLTLGEPSLAATPEAALNIVRNRPAPTVFEVVENPLTGVSSNVPLVEARGVVTELGSVRQVGIPLAEGGGLLSLGQQSPKIPRRLSVNAFSDSGFQYSIADFNVQTPRARPVALLEDLRSPVQRAFDNQQPGFSGGLFSDRRAQLTFGRQQSIPKLPIAELQESSSPSVSDFVPSDLSSRFNLRSPLILESPVVDRDFITNPRSSPSIFEDTVLGSPSIQSSNVVLIPNQAVQPLVSQRLESGLRSRESQLLREEQDFIPKLDSGLRLEQSQQIDIQPALDLDTEQVITPVPFLFTPQQPRGRSSQTSKTVIPRALPPPIVSFDGGSSALFRISVGLAGQETAADFGIGGEDTLRKAIAKVRSDASASLNVVPINAAAREFNLQRALGREFRPSKSRPDTFVERSAFRIDSPSEKSQITERGILANIAKEFGLDKPVASPLRSQRSADFTVAALDQGFSLASIRKSLREGLF